MADVVISVGQTGAESTAAAIGKVGESAKHAGKGAESMGKEFGETIHTAHRMETGLNAIERTLGENTSAAHAFGGGLRVISQAMKALMMDGPQLLITVAILALGAAINAVVGHFEEMKKKNEEAKKASEEHAKALGEMQAIKFTALIKQYDEVQKAADAAADAAERLQSAQVKLLSAQEKRQIAGIEAKASAQLAGLDASSPLYDESKKAIQEQKARDVSDVQVQFANKQADIELLAAKQKEARVLNDFAMATAKRMAIEKELEEKTQERSTLMRAHYSHPQDPETQKVFEIRKESLEKQIEELDVRSKEQWAVSKKVAHDANVAGVDVQSAEVSHGATDLQGLTKGLDFAAQNNEIVAKDTPAFAGMAASGDPALLAFVAQFQQFATANTSTLTTLTAQLAKHTDLLNQHAISQQ